MRVSTKAIHEQLGALGTALGIEPTTEVGKSLWLRLDEAYPSRVAILGWLPLDERGGER
jgi:hypothetical protein